MDKAIARSARKRKKLRSLDSQPYRRIYFLLVFGIILYIGVYFGSLHYQNFILMERRIKEVNAEHKQKNGRIHELRQEVQRLHNVEHLKQIARKDLYLMEPREVYIKIVPGPASNQQNSQQKKSDKQ